MKKIILVSLLLIIMVASASASLQVDAKRNQNSIYLDEQATFSLTIGNPDTVSKVIQVYSSDVRWFAEMDPFVTRIEPNETLKVELKLIPSVWAETGSQAVNVFIETPTTGEKISMNLPVYVKSYDQGEKDYNPSVEMKITFPEKADPRQEMNLNIYLRNRNRLDISELKIVVDSNIFHEERSFSLGPMSERREIINVNIDPLTPPQDDSMEVSLIINNKTINKERLSFNLIAYSTFSPKVDTLDELFKRTTEYEIVNYGNIKKVDYFSAPTTVLKRLFTTSSPKIDKFNLKNEPSMQWKLSLEPMEETKIVVVENYRPMIYFILIMIVVTMIYFIYRSPIIVRKEAIIIGSSSEGISDMKILLHIRNRSQDLIEHIKVTDLIPSIVELIKEGNLGTLAPSKILKNDKKGTIIKWELDALEPFEERIISYRLTSKIAIVGGLTLPPTKVKFEIKGGKERTIKSNVATVSLGL